MVNTRKVENSRVNFQSNKHINLLLKNIFAVFTTFKQLFCNFINNANHTRRKFISLLTNIQTTSFANGKSYYTSQQLVNIISKDNSL